MIVLSARAWVTARKARKLTTASASGCRAYYPRSTESVYGNAEVICHLQLVFSL